MTDLEKYARVHFTSEEADDQRDFLLAMNNVGIITISREDIDECYREFIEKGIGSVNCLVLHGEEQIQKFTYLMRYFFPGKEYDLSDEPFNKAFSDFVEKTEKKVV